MGRGKLTEKATKIAKDFLGRDIDVTELRLYSYLDYTIKNSQKLKPEHINSNDRKILSNLKEEKHIEGGVTGLSMTREFYDYIQDILFETYVDIWD